MIGALAYVNAPRCSSFSMARTLTVFASEPDVRL